MTSGDIDWDRVERNAERFGNEMIWRPYGFPDIVNPYRTAFSEHEVLPRWDVSDKVLISTTITGAFYNRDANPNQPLTVPEITASAQEAIAAGSPAVHIHVRDERGYNVLSPERFAQAIEPIRDTTPEVFIDGCLVPALPGEWDKIQPVLDQQLLDGVPVNTTAAYFGDALFAKPPHMMIEKTAMIEESGGRVEIAVYTDADVDNAHRYLIRPGVVSDPLVWIILPALPGCSPMQNPRQMVNGLTRIVESIYDIDEQSVIIVCAAGRASTYLVGLALLMGLHVRVGMEDTVWLWPHRDDRIESNASHFELAKTLATTLGRDVMTPAEVRDLMQVGSRTSGAGAEIIESP